MKFRSACIDSLKGRHSLQQLLNTAKYLMGERKLILNYDPVFLTAFLTYNCNLSCDMCLTHSTKFNYEFKQKQVTDLKFDLFKEALDIFKNAIFISIMGNGEPLLNKDIFRMINYASNIRKMYTFSSSNGISLGYYIEEIIQSNLTEFNISINGHNSNEFSRMTGMDIKFFKIIVNNIKELVKERNKESSNIKINLSMIIDKCNYRDMEKMIHFGEKLQIDGILFNNFLAPELEGFSSNERSLFSDENNVINVISNINLERKKRRIQVSLPTLLDRNPSGKYCLSPFSNFCFDGSGKVGCCSVKLLDFSNNEKFNEPNVWNNTYFQEMRRRFLDVDYPILQPCASCFNNTPNCQTMGSPQIRKLSKFIHKKRL